MKKIVTIVLCFILSLVACRARKEYYERIATDENSDGLYSTESLGSSISADSDATVTVWWLQENAIPYTNEYSDELYYILDEVQEDDVTLYGKAEYTSMILRVGEEIYPINRSWTDHYITPKLLCGDFDLDGDTEYAIVSQWGTGSECNNFSLLIMELRDGNMKEKVYIEGNQVWGPEYEKVSMDYSKTSGVAVIRFDEGKQKEIIITETNTDYQPVSLGFGEIFGYTEIDGKLYHWINVGFMYPERAVPSYVDSFIVIAPLLFDDENNVRIEKFEIFEGNYEELIYS